MDKKRESGLDLLRIFAAFFVCAVHVCNVEREQAVNPEVLDFSYHYFWILFRLGQTAVACFIALSGAFALRARSTLDYASFYKKAKKKVVIPTIVFTIFYFFFESFIKYESGVYADAAGNNVSYVTALLNQLPGTILGFPAVHMWYMFMLMILYLLLPFVAQAKEKMGEHNFAVASVVLWILGTIDAISSPPNVAWSLGYCADILGIVMLGYVFHEWALKKKGNRTLGFGMIAAGCAVIAAEYLITLAIRNNDALLKLLPQRPHSPFLSMAALLLIAGFTMMDIKANLGWLSLLTFWVYIVHPAVMQPVFAVEGAILGIPFAQVGEKDPVLIGTVNMVIVFILSFVVSHFIEKWRGRKA